MARFPRMTVTATVLFYTPLTARASLCVLVLEQLQIFVLEVRRQLVRSGLQGELDDESWLPAEALERLKPYEPTVRDNSLCSSMDGPFCGLFPTAAPMPSKAPIVADGALFAGDFNLLRNPDTRVSCGGHRAKNCSACPQGNGQSFCHGDCLWLQDQCVHKNAASKYQAMAISAVSKVSRPEMRNVSCGGHKALNCSLCPQGNGASWCHGDCAWVAGECVFSPNMGVFCGGHRARSCAECSQGKGEEWCHGDCVWIDDQCDEKKKGDVWCGSHAARNCSSCPLEDGEIWCTADCMLWAEECVAKTMFEKMPNTESVANLAGGVSCGQNVTASRCSECPRGIGNNESLWCHGDCVILADECLEKRKLRRKEKP